MLNKDTVQRMKVFKSIARLADRKGHTLMSDVAQNTGKPFSQVNTHTYMLRTEGLVTGKLERVVINTKTGKESPRLHLTLTDKGQTYAARYGIKFGATKTKSTIRPAVLSPAYGDKLPTVTKATTKKK